MWKRARKKSSSNIFIVTIAIILAGILISKISSFADSPIEFERNAWNRMSDDEKIDALQTAYEDPDEAMKHYEKKWKDLPSVATQNMYKESKLTESMIGIKTKANFKPNSLKGALERAGIKGFQMNRLSWSLTALKVDKKDFNIWVTYDSYDVINAGVECFR